LTRHHTDPAVQLPNTISVRLSHDDFALLMHRAKQESRTVSNFVRLLLQDALKPEGRRP